MNNNCLRQEKVLSASVLPKLSGVVVFIYSCMNFLTGHHIIAGNNLLAHLMLWHFSTVLTTSGQHCLSFQSKLLQIQSWEGEFSKFSWGMPLDP